MLEDSAKIPATVIFWTGCSCESRMVWLFEVTYASGTSNLLVGVTTPVSSAAAIVMTFAVDPGSKTLDTARDPHVDGSDELRSPGFTVSVSPRASTAPVLTSCTIAKP